MSSMSSVRSGMSKTIGDGHFSAKCHYCAEAWSRGKPELLKEHLVLHCSAVPTNVKLEYMQILIEQSSSSNKIQKINSSNPSITNYIDSSVEIDTNDDLFEYGEDNELFEYGEEDQNEEEDESLGLNNDILFMEGIMNLSLGFDVNGNEDESTTRNEQEVFDHGDPYETAQILEKSVTPVTIYDAICFTKKAWGSVTSTVIKNCWKHTGILPENLEFLNNVE
ncbi:12181_t:CDS:2, partial [Entrophospora sp. SA101]